ncbi:MAG TPA: carboxypeptidase-like regulatory domain-containing protein, partial [Chitinophagaceae bacterium]
MLLDFFLRCKKMFFLISLLAMSCIAMAQRIVSGSIIDENQKPVSGATVMVKGTNKQTVSNENGRFSIDATDQDMLVITHVSFLPLEIKATQASNISLTSTARNLSEVVVTATGIRKEAKRLGYAIQTIDASTLTQAREADPVNSLKGNSAGLEININQEIGHPADVIIRGENAPDDRPMFVVDGVPITSDTYNINPDDIESFTVLKGPNAAALYGFQGKNGAIIINTKKGNSGKKGVSVTFNSSTQFYKGFIALPKYNDEYGPGDNGKYAFGGGGSSPASYFGSGAVGVGVNDYDYDVWGPQFRGQLLPQYDGAYDASKNYTTTFADGSTYTGHVQPTPWLARGKDNLKKFVQTGLLS